MKKKVLSTLLVASMAACLFAGCSGESSSSASNSGNNDATTPAGNQETTTLADYGSGEIKLWAPSETVDLTKEYAEKFIKDNEAYSGYTITVEAMSEADAATGVITDIEAAADIFAFPQDQLTRLVAAGSLTPMTGTAYEAWIGENNDAGSVGASKVGDVTYAFPITSDNGYFLYYDKSIVTDVSTLEGILDQCEAAGKSFYFDLDNTWYITSFFFATGAQISYDVDATGAFTACNANWNSDEGLVAYKECIEMVNHKAFADGCDPDSVTAEQIGAMVSGTWEAESMKNILKDNYACAKLPKFTGSDGKEYQMAGFGGFKLLGVKPQTEKGKAVVCLELAQYLSSEEVQLARYEAASSGPSNLKAQQSEAVQADAALSALGAQFAHMTPQGQFPQAFWDAGTALATEVYSKTVTPDSSDDDLMKNLKKFQDDCVAAATGA